MESPLPEEVCGRVDYLALLIVAASWALMPNHKIPLSRYLRNLPIVQ